MMKINGKTASMISAAKLVTLACEGRGKIAHKAFAEIKRRNSLRAGSRRVEDLDPVWRKAIEAWAPR